MGTGKKRQKIIMSVGGSVIVPDDGITIKFLKKLNIFIRDQLAKNSNRQFFLVIGGGATAREYRDAGRDVVGHDLTFWDLDWLGIHATRLNAHLVRTIFQDIAHPKLITDYEVIQKTNDSVVVAAGWKPGWSTDYCAALLCEDYEIDTILNVSNVPQVYDKDPNQFSDAKSKDTMSWEEFRELVGDEWVPGMHAPFDPIAAKKAQDLGVRTIILSDDFDNINKFLAGEKFVGTIIE